jgi:pimeloyl-ACP methyl ester carboxylesterase
LLLLHANPGDARDWEAVVPDLSKRFRVIALEWPGYAQSPLLPDPETISTLWFYGILVELFEKMKFERVILVGNSLGGMIAARFA